jgi:hypothetical protein
MSDTIVVASLGTCVRIRCHDSTIAAQIARLYDACVCDAISDDAIAFDVEIRHRDGADYEVLADGETRWHGHDRDRVFEWCAWLVNNAANERASQLVLHAAAVAIHGCAVLLTGPSGSGKSTLATALTLRGAVYMGDDSVAVDEHHGICANPKPIALDPTARGALRRLDRDNHELRGESSLAAPRGIGASMSAGDVARPGVIVRTTYRAGAATSLVQMSHADAAAFLADQSFNFATLGGSTLQAAGGVARETVAYALEFSDLAAAVDAVLNAVTRADVRHDDDPPGFAHNDLQVEFFGGEALIWKSDDAELHHLSRTASDIWRACSLSDDPEVVAAAIIGSEPTPIMLADVRRCMDELRASGLLSVGAGCRPPMTV